MTNLKKIREEFREYFKKEAVGNDLVIDWIADFFLQKLADHDREIVATLKKNCPVIDGMTVREGRLYLSLKLGDLEAFEEFRILPESIITTLTQGNKDL